MGLFGGLLLKETPQLTVPFHYFDRDVIIASSFSRSYFLALLLLDMWLLEFSQPIKVSGKVRLTANLASHHLTLMMSLSELVRKPRVDRKWLVGQRLQRIQPANKHRGGSLYYQVCYQEAFCCCWCQETYCRGGG